MYSHVKERENNTNVNLHLLKIFFILLQNINQNIITMVILLNRISGIFRLKSYS